MSRLITTERKTFLNISSFQVLAMFRRTMFYGYLSIYLRYFLGLSITETTFFVTFPMILSVLFQTFVWGRLSDKLQLRRTLIIVGEISAAITTTLVWYLHTLPESHSAAGWVIILGLSFVEIFWSMSNIGWSALLSDLYSDRERAGIQGKLSSIGALGRVAGVWVGGLMYDGLARHYEGWGFDTGVLFFIASAAMLISTIPMIFVPEGGIKKSPSESASGMAVAETVEAAVPRKFWVFLLAMVFINFGQNSVALIKSQYLVLDEGFNVSSQLLSYILNMASIAMFFTGLFVKRLAVRWRDETLLLWGAILNILYLTVFAMALDLYSLFISNFVSGVAMVIIYSCSYSYAARLIPPSRRARLFSLFNATFFLSWGIPATVVAGPVVDLLIKYGATQTFAFRMSFLSSALLAATGVVILFWNIRMKNNGAPVPQ